MIYRLVVGVVGGDFFRCKAAHPRGARKPYLLVLGTFFKFLLPSEYRVPSGCIRLTSDYNLFFYFILEQDTDKRVNLKISTNPTVHNSKLSFRNSCMDTFSPDIHSLLFLRSHPIHENTLSAWVLVPGTLCLMSK